ncbi:MAG TPA: ElyC/SanA/YdcF family protein [Flavipsychrobacter sp.]|nr:ElyC/SanA/YdcF family protein [Flavipsychrobacter sp.]
MRKLRNIIIVSLLLAIGLVFYCNKKIISASKEKLYESMETLPYNKVGLLLGTSKYLSDGRINLYYQYRIDAALQLYKAGKIKYIVVSGDNSRVTYNEPQTMYEDLIRAGVDSTHIYLDYAGFRTFDSIIRLREIFGQSKATVISQQFHNERAVYIASRENMDVIAFNARDVNQNAGIKTQLREKLARVKVFADFIFHTKPKFLGKRVNIPE